MRLFCLRNLEGYGTRHQQDADATWNDNCPSLSSELTESRASGQSSPDPNFVVVSRLPEFVLP